MRARPLNESAVRTASVAACARSWSDPGRPRQGRARRSCGSRANRPRARRSRARSRALRSSRAAATESTAPAATRGAPSPARRTPDTAPRRTGRSRLRRGWRSAARRTDGRARRGARWPESRSALARACVCPSPWVAVYGVTRAFGDGSVTNFHHGLLAHSSKSRCSRATVSRMTGSSVGIDVGGTFTDFVVRAPSGRLSSGKVPTTPANPALGVMQGLTTLVGSAPLASVAHGTTIVTNAIIEGRGAVVGLISTRGFRDVLEIARVSRLHLYDLKAAPKPPALVPRRLRLEVSERVGPDGAIERALTLDEIPELVATLTREGVESVAVCLLHSYANPEHERTLRAYLERHFRHVCVSSDINAEFREYERSCTTVLNAAVMPLASRYIEQLDQRLGLQAAGATLHLLHSAGGMMSVETARARPLALASSGPAAGVAAAAHVAKTLGIPRALAFDMGGTTTDVCLMADGIAETSAQRRLGGYPVRLPMAAVESIGAGGGSIAYVDAAGALRVGPRSAGAPPRPPGYGLRGARPPGPHPHPPPGHLHPPRL